MKSRGAIAKTSKEKFGLSKRASSIMRLASDIMQPLPLKLNNLISLFKAWEIARDKFSALE